MQVEIARAVLTQAEDRNARARQGTDIDPAEQLGLARQHAQRAQDALGDLGEVRILRAGRQAQGVDAVGAEVALAGDDVLLDACAARAARKSTSESAIRRTRAAQAATFWVIWAGSILSRVSSAVWCRSK